MPHHNVAIVQKYPSTVVPFQTIIFIVIINQAYAYQMSLLSSFVSIVLLSLVVLFPHSHALTIVTTTTTRTTTRRTSTIVHHAQRYGPSSDSTFTNDNDVDDVFDRNAERNLSAFRQLLQKVLEQASSSSPSSSSSSADQIPSLLGQNIPILVSMMQQRHVMETMLNDALLSGGPAEEAKVADALEYMFEFAETFCDTLKALDDGNKQLLGRIIRSAQASSSFTTATTATKTDHDDSSSSFAPPMSSSSSLSLDELLESERDNLTPGFLRHVEGECERIANAPSTTPESLRLLQMLRTIQVRVVEELGKELGDEALVLGQLLGYDDPRERIAVLRTGMGVRGVEFSKQMGTLTEQALSDFQRLGVGVADPELVERVQGIHDAIQEFLELQKA